MKEAHKPEPLPYDIHSAGSSFDDDAQLDIRDGRYVVRLFNQGGYDCTEMDVVNLITWLKKNKPELLK